ncbi:MAG: hypothetical protein K2Y22_17150 [Candidatus Obscuribacterales bacterium]|nr:hypothetical protein [Candidatus Obscuribacterales bacterium]
MNLRYPNGRLLILDLLHKEGISCAEALIRGAYAVGLITEGSLSHNGNCQKCGSLSASRQIVEAYFKQHCSQLSKGGCAEMIKQVTSGIETDVEAYKAKTGLVHPRTEIPDPLDCSNMAPYVFDFMLQHLHRYQ